MRDELINREYLLNCAEYDDNGRLVIPYKTVENAPTAFDKEKVIEEFKKLYEDAEKYWNNFDDEDSLGEMKAYIRAISIVKKGGVTS